MVSVRPTQYAASVARHIALEYMFGKLRKVRSLCAKESSINK